MDITEEKKGNASVISIKGRLDSASSSEVEKLILALINQGTKDIILDFSSLEYIASAGIRILVWCLKEIEKRQGRIFLASVPKPIENVLYVTGFLPYFKVFDTPNHAIDAMKNPPKGL